jgi:hypothetical protein
VRRGDGRRAPLALFVGVAPVDAAIGVQPVGNSLPRVLARFLAGVNGHPGLTGERDKNATPSRAVVSMLWCSKFGARDFKASTLEALQGLE